MVRIVLCCLVLFTTVGWAQPTTPLEGCQSELKKWQEWGRINAPRHEQLIRDYEMLEQDRSNQLAAFIAGGLAIGFGGGMAVLGIKGLRRIWPLSRERKQLAVLILGAAWITIAGFVVANDSWLSQHPVNMLLTIFVYSLPALLFGGIGAWWFGRARRGEQRVETQ